MAHRMEMAEIHAVLAEILRAIVRLCDDEGIEYFLIGGGCLGIVRHHHSFVPWDDDLDVSIWAGDLERFLAAAHRLPGGYAVRRTQGPPFPTCKVEDRSTRIVGTDGVARDTGVFVDIVPMMHWQSLAWKRLDDVVGLMAQARDREYSPVRWKRVTKQIVRRTGLAHIVAPVAAAWLHPTFLAQDRACRPGRQGVVSGAIGHRWRGRYPREVIYPLQKAMLAGVAVDVSRDLHRFLHLRYGPDYMAMPAPGAIWNHFERAYRVTT